MDFCIIGLFFTLGTLLTSQSPLHILQLANSFSWTPMKRTMSMKQLSLDLVSTASPMKIPPQPLDVEPPRNGKSPPLPTLQRGLKRRISRDPSVGVASSFLMAYVLCKHSLNPSFDTSMYSHPLVDVNMKELSLTCFMSNHGHQEEEEIRWLEALKRERQK